MGNLAAVRVLIADDHTLVRESLVNLLQASGDITVVAQASDGLETVEKALATRPDIVITDISMPHLNGIEVVRRLRESLPEVRVLVLTMHSEDEYVLQLVRAGASGYLVKDSAASELLAAIQCLRDGRGYFGPQASRILAEQLQNPDRQVDDPYGRLTAREREVFHLIAEGMTTKEIARALDLQEVTVKLHVRNLCRKLETKNRTQIAVRLAQLGQFM